jgi:hypothetical protein
MYRVHWRRDPLGRSRRNEADYPRGEDTHTFWMIPLLILGDGALAGLVGVQPRQP